MEGRFEDGLLFLWREGFRSGAVFEGELSDIDG